MGVQTYIFNLIYLMLKWIFAVREHRYYLNNDKKYKKMTVSVNCYFFFFYVFRFSAKCFICYSPSGNYSLEKVGIIVIILVNNNKIVILKNIIILRAKYVHIL